MKIDEVELAVPEGYQLILGQSHFIKTVEDLYETLASSMPGAKFGISFCESSGKALIRYDGTDAESVKSRRSSRDGCPRDTPSSSSFTAPTPSTSSTESSFLTRWLESTVPQPIRSCRSSRTSGKEEGYWGWWTA